MKTKFLFLDDERNPIDCASYMYSRLPDLRMYHKEWDIVRSYKDFVDHITKNGLPDVISFDHDLGMGKTGMDCAKWLVEYCIDNNETLPVYIVHSMNPSGAKNIRGLLDGFKKHQLGK